MAVTFIWALNASGRCGQELFFSGPYSMMVMTEMEMNGLFDYCD